VKIKVCGITNREDARAAAELGFDAVGFIFVPSSRRCVTPLAAAEIIRDLPPGVMPVGVFADAGREETMHAIAVSGVRTIQLHGEESPAAMEGYPVPVWKAFGVDETFDPAVLAAYRVEAYLLDARQEGRTGGTGTTFDWQRAVEAKKFGAIVLAGGLTPENAAQAVVAVRPAGIDVNSGVEISPGRKDHHKMRRLIASVRSLNY
jgi:phosphoribosylanthranilate isomerase